MRAIGTPRLRIADASVCPLVPVRAWWDRPSTCSQPRIVDWTTQCSGSVEAPG